MLSTCRYAIQPGLNPNLFPLFGTQYLLNVSQVLRSTDKASIRKHKLSTELVIWLIIGMGFIVISTSPMR
ncbi:transposase domain-containing protein [Citrobacter braakii]|nr:transposase domain-containing protein [Citrobacter braakii]